MIAIGCDHAGNALKKEIIEYLMQKGYNVTDYGCQDGEAADYPDIAKIVCDEINKKTHKFAILICGTGIGISMSANKIKGIRAALCSDHFSAKYTRLHNDANVMCLGARTIGAGIACELAEIFVTTEFEGGRHKRRVDKIMALEN